MDYITWVREALDRKPHLSQSGLARHLGRHRAVISKLLQGERQIKALELEKIADYLGEPIPGRKGQAAPGTAPLVPVVGRIGNAWYERGSRPTHEARSVYGLTAPQWQGWSLSAYDLDVPVDDLPAGATVIAGAVDRAHRPAKGNLVVCERDRSGLVNLMVARVSDDELPGKPIAIVIEARIPLA